MGGFWYTFFMKIILLNGLLASGKTTVGELLKERLINSGERVAFIDLDDEVEKIHGSHKFETPDKKKEVWLQARKNIAEVTNSNSVKGVTTIIAGPFFQKDEIDWFTKYLDPKAEVYLYTLIVPLDIRLKRNRQRRWPNPDEGIYSQYQIFKKLNEHFGEYIENTGTTQETVDKILQCIQEGLGGISMA